MDWSSVESQPGLQLLSWKLDVEWCGFMFSDTSQSPQDTSLHWETLAANLGLVTKLPTSPQPQVPSNYTPVKVTGVVLLLGLGSYLCYKLYKVWLYHRFQGSESSRGDSDSPPPPAGSDGTLAFSYHHLSEPSSSSIKDFLNVKSRYFGPLHLNNDDSYSGNETQCQDTSVPSEQEMSCWENQSRPRERKRRLKPTSPHSSFRRGWILHKLHALGLGHQKTLNGDDNSSSKNSSRRGGNSTGTSSTGSSPVSYPHHHSLSRDLSFDSLGLLNRPRREGSIDSMSSEFSFDMPSFAEPNPDCPGTVQRIEELLEEIDQLKNNCLDQQEVFESVKCNRNLPGMSDLMEVAEHLDGEFSVEDIVRQQSAKACFKGLYSLTTINRSISLDLSLDEDSPQTSNQFNLTQVTEEEQYPSLEWDEEYSPENEQESGKDQSLEQNTRVSAPSIVKADCSKNGVVQPTLGNNNGSLDLYQINGNEEVDDENNCIVDMYDSTTLEAQHGTSTPTLSSRMNSSGYESKLDLSNSLTSSQFSGFGSPMSPFEDFQDVYRDTLQRSMSVESQSEALSLTETDSVSVDVKPESPVCTATPQRHLNIGPRVDIMSYARQEWTGNTPTALTILRGYKEIAESLQYRYLRRIRGDNYCALRSTVFQSLVHGVSMPSSTTTLTQLSRTHNIGSQWRFNGLPYTGNNVLKGMEICLQSLDNISALLRNSQRSVEEKEDTLYNLLNTDPSLDTHVMEALKLHMMAEVLQLHKAYSEGQDVPLFCILLFARDTSEVPLDFMNNHLLKVGDTGGLEQVEMFLLGHVLGVTLKVVRPSAHGTQQFVCYYPDDFVGQWPQVTLVAEDDRHFNILCA